jgi:hypothetical protein
VPEALCPLGGAKHIVPPVRITSSMRSWLRAVGRQETIALVVFGQRLFNSLAWTTGKYLAHYCRTVPFDSALHSRGHVVPRPLGVDLDQVDPVEVIFFDKLSTDITSTLEAERSVSLTPRRRIKASDSLEVLGIPTSTWKKPAAPLFFPSANLEHAILVTLFNETFALIAREPSTAVRRRAHARWGSH